MGTDDESFEGLALPCSCLADFVCECAYLRDSVECDVYRFDEPPFISKGVYRVWRKGIEFLGAGIDAMEV
jgi:hypothetical protein